MKLKKLISYLLTFSLIFSFITIPASAQEDNEEFIGYTGPVELGYIDFDTTNTDLAGKELILQGSNLVKQRLYKYLNVSRLTQTDSRWGDEIMETAGLTIRDAGCILTSFTMVVRYNGFSDNPAQVNNEIGNHACPFHYASAANCYGLSIYESAGSVSDTSAINFIVAAVANDRPVLVALKNGSSTHTVLAYGYSGSTIAIHDPETRWATPYSTLNDFFNRGWYVTSLYTFS